MIVHLSLNVWTKRRILATSTVLHSIDDTALPEEVYTVKMMLFRVRFEGTDNGNQRRGNQRTT